MRTIKLFLVFLCLASLAQAQETETRNVSDFSALSSSGSFDVYLEEGNETAVRLVAEGIALEDIETEVKNGKLSIRPRRKNSGWGGYRNVKVKAYVSYRQLESLELHGSGSIEARSVLTGTALNMEIHGSGDIEGEVDTRTLSVEIHGSGDMNLRGKSEKVSSQIHGSGDIEAYGLKTRRLEAQVHGSGDIEIAVSEEIDAKVYGSGGVSYKGNPSREYVKTHGSGEVRRVN